MNILAIGNSFSQDATRYLHAVAHSDRCELQVANLYIGGCSLERHYRNWLGNLRDYTLQYNGQLTGFPVSIEEALLNREWDVITLQQASHFSVDINTYFPYLTVLNEAVRRYQPHAKVVLHQTWSYEDGCERMQRLLGYSDAERMYRELHAAYAEAAERIGADGIIPSGELFRMLQKNGMSGIHRDTFHAGLGGGRYALALLWYRTLCGADVQGNGFADFDVPVTREEIALIQDCVSRFAPLF